MRLYSLFGLVAIHAVSYDRKNVMKYHIKNSSVITDSQTCGHVLGMRDGFIEDFQIWSSSEEPAFPSQKGRPGDVGWCPNIEDVETYFFQVNIK